MAANDGDAAEVPPTALRPSGCSVPPSPSAAVHDPATTYGMMAADADKATSGTSRNLSFGV